MHPTAIALQYLNAIYRYRLVAVCALLVGLTVTVWTVRTLRDVYMSTTLIMVEPQDVPQAYVRSTVDTRIESRLQALSQEVLSRTRLEAIIEDFGLFAALREKNVPREDIVNAMRGKIHINVFPKDNAFRISYEGSDRHVVQRVTARLAGLYIDENLRIREQHVAGTTEFMESELDKVRKRLEDHEAQIQSFKQQHMGELPEQQETNLRALEGLRLQLQTNSMALSSALERRLLLDKQAAEVRSTRAAQPAGQTLATSPYARLQQLEASLAELRSRYRDEHPDVVTLQTQIARLRDELPAGAREDGALPFELTTALTQVRLDVRRLQEEERRIRAAIESYQIRTENAFVREQELQTLTRDYDVTRQKYQTLLEKKLEAQLSQSLEMRQKGERFRVLDPASLPEAPARPNRSALISTGAAASVGLALLLPILLWQLDPSFRLAEEIISHAIPVLAVIPQIQTPDIRRRNQRYRLRVITVSAITLVIGLGTASLYARYLF